MTQLRVMTYNVRSLRDGIDRVAAVIRTCEPDVVAIQEAPRFWRSGARCRDLADRCGLAYVTGGRSAAAMLILARPGLAIVGRHNVKLPWRPPRHRRGLAVGVFDVAGQRLAVAAGHVSLDDDERLAQAQAYLAAGMATGVPFVLGVDLNETPDGASWGLLARGYQDAHAVAGVGDGATFPSSRPQRRIDAVFVDRSLRVVGCEVVNLAGVDAASDHRPVLATIQIGL